ncbi:MAG: hypothetical protein BWY14_00267 [Parcubacteria group bacterium ADurb.Bin192]|nr:MAG: hypothetical protein BWY14_00267 [Parcubacteria group bacterium ADurb.Bin192]
MLHVTCFVTCDVKYVKYAMDVMYVRCVKYAISQFFCLTINQRKDILVMRGKTFVKTTTAALAALAKEQDDS